MSETNSLKHRPIRSYILRQGRMTQAQQRAFDELWPHYGCQAPDGLFDFDKLFGNQRPVILEIGFGNGDALAQNADREPENNFLGVEVHGPGVGSLMLKLAEQESHNARILRDDAMQLLRQHIPAGSLTGVLLFFPDPWPKRRHHKRRIVQPEFAELVHRALHPGGYLHMATDWQKYAEHMMSVLSSTAGFANAAGPGNFSPRPENRTLTRFEQRGQRLGHGVWDLIFTRCV
ncbi:tRNA (guanosine(46)-N7)-methyltransferase TrmB [endosymbiont of Ridgeia piscesae]|jgi:tRNA (guanine-N7-)-methyltransferase|uniref:tRNA (guanine-N(7)-)-methyltransferase n=1 Tax=endosymbiont of Ridgeia piscesae TaxID=54398 RepID=A0A0T5Z1S6_9GAMM|nr:tRNA (guanosine(46)-N7)-methyltransferase TrmB [endosymbiont of Ridgeia piscesae]KRT54215.1 tRNA (guanine-N(7)-)-methyltransferase [endosymbiont of Ridgeia piscesae]KRT56755.1 tRNA (guanine-N(7)-)-methyltransferase [endosymbiont of Ridgeia piscesae]